VDGLLGFWVLSAVFAMVGTAIRGLIRPISWTTLAIATLLMAPGKITETVNAVRDREVKLALPNLPPPPLPSPSATSTDAVPLIPGETPTDRARSLELAEKTRPWVDDIGAPVLQPVNKSTRPVTDSTDSTDSTTADSRGESNSDANKSLDPVPALW
jgi:hypothetical protein